MKANIFIWSSTWLWAVCFAAAASEQFIVYSGDHLRRGIELTESPVPLPPTLTAAPPVAAPTAAAAVPAMPAKAAVPGAGSKSNETAANPGNWKKHKNSWSGCEDKPPEATGFEVHTSEGFLGFASCTDLSTKCHSWVNSTRVQQACPVSCFVCDPNMKKKHQGPPCYDSAVTGVRFKAGPQATCTDLANYCNHSTLNAHVQAACRLTCGLCEAHVGHVAGRQCQDLESHDEPVLMVAGEVAACTDLMDFCSSTANAYLIRHKCPRTCKACPEVSTSTHSSYTTSKEASFNSGEEPSDCSRRRRWGFCSTRRRRNL